VQPNGAAAIAAVPAARATAVAARSLPRGQAALYSRPVAVPDPEAEGDDEEAPETIEDIIAAAEGAAIAPAETEIDEDEPVDEAPPRPVRLERPSARKPALSAPANGPAKAEGRPLPAIVARAEAAKNGRPAARTHEPAKRLNGSSDGAEALTRSHGPRQSHGEPAEPVRNGHAAMSSVREVELETPAEADPQRAIERAIATLEREARNDEDEAFSTADNEVASGRAGAAARRRSAVDKGFVEPTPHEAAVSPALPDPAFARPQGEVERGGGNAVTIFLLVFLVLLMGAGGAGYWAWHEGYIDLDAMFGRAPQVATSTAPTAPAAVPPPMAQSGSPAVANATPATGAAATTNTEPAPSTSSQAAETMSATPAPASDATQPASPAPDKAAPEPSAQTGAGPKSEDRLAESTETPVAPAAAPDAAKPADGGAAVAPAVAGSQSLLLEASQDGTTGAVPFSGTVEWTKGTDELGQPTLVGKANIPARNLGVSVLIRKNSDPTLPASHLMEINFTVNDSFIGGAISGLPGVLLKNEELVQGTPLVGASARVVGNSFLFALSSSPTDETTNKDLLTTRKWIDLAIIYATGKKAIITLEKDDKAEALFNEVFADWSRTAAKPATPPAAAAGG
jgi:hypothetical protein